MDRSRSISLESLALACSRKCMKGFQRENSPHTKKKPQQFSNQSPLLGQIVVEKGGFCFFISHVLVGETEMEIKQREKILNSDF
jgi:hypothetical protein